MDWVLQGAGILTIKKTKEKQKGFFLTPGERETLISWNDEDGDKIFISTSQQPMIRRLLKNPLFEVLHKSYNRRYACFPGPICVGGYLPKKALTIRRKFRKLTPKQKKKAQETLRFARETQKH